MKTQHIIISIIGLFLVSMAGIVVFVYATDLGNWGYKIAGNTSITVSLDSFGNTSNTSTSNIPEHEIVKEINGFSCAKNVFVPSKTSIEFSGRYTNSHNCYDIIDADPICENISNTCTIGIASNLVENNNLGCGYGICLRNEEGIGDTRDCTNGSKTTSCISSSYTCQSLAACF